MWNTVKSTLLLGVLTGMFVVIGSALGGQTGMWIAFAFAIIMNFGAWWFSDTLALKMSGAKSVSESEAPELHRRVAELAMRADIPKPAVYLIESESPNAFATGRSPSKGAVAVTTGIMRMLNRSELDGVIAHELAHIKHRDTLISSIAATIAGAITMIAEMAQWAMLFSGLSGSQNDDEEESAGGWVGSIILMIVAPIAALLIQMAISRSREFLADAAGAKIAGSSVGLANALRKLEMGAQASPLAVNPATSHLYIVNPLRGGLMGLFSTHPNTAERIARLEAMSHNQVAWA